ncbi:hypothetical protein EDD18DRAFT_1311350 [Armillaria luteobubalina]|uniref:inositol-3-phosphate synthase n=1 Tax=Armillaria luteobubalina TaxID=153913 RepID=A0AA39PQ36_9AGAR|nr:hypothetical protein EDD18DRAFT_1311350 [Armillaria luteobubalina]
MAPDDSGYTIPESELVLPIYPTAAHCPHTIVMQSENVAFTDKHITAKFHDHNTNITVANGQYIVNPTTELFEFQTKHQVSKASLMMIGMGGNNGSTLCAIILANHHNVIWHTKSGIQQPNYISSLLCAFTIHIGTDTATGKDIHVPFSDVLPMVHPNNLILRGWDISGLSLDKAMEQAFIPHIAQLKPLPSIYYPNFIAANQEACADNLIPGSDKQAHVEHIHADICNNLIPDVNDTADNVLNTIKTSHLEVSPSSVSAVATILEDEPFINSASQNTFMPGIIKLAEHEKSFIGGDDLELGQTKLKSVLAEFLINAGSKPLSITSYDHLGNNDGHNLSAERHKSSIVDDMVDENRLLFKAPESDAKGKGEHPDHVMVIKYIPAIGDSKRAINEYHSEIFCGGWLTINIFNKCEHPLIALLSYMLKALLIKPGTEVINSLHRQCNVLDAFLEACIG